MKNLVSTYVEQFRQDRQKQIRLVAILAALAVVVAGVVFWQLHNTGVAMTNEVFCGQEEHTHTDACYSEVLTCGLEETEGETGHVHTDACYDEDGTLICGLTESEGTEAHVHSDACYETVLICGIPEHTHTVECLIDETADVETADMWETTLPEELSGNWAEDVVAVAESQVGYTESEQNFQLAEDGETHQGYTRYGAWYGNEYGDWDAMFVSFCLNYADVPESEIPENSGAYALSAAVHEAGLYIDSEAFTPNAGDLVFFDEDADGHADRVGIIADIDDEGELTVIEGDFEDAVAENDYGAGNEMILAYGILPEQEDDSEEQEYDRAESVILSAGEPEEKEEEEEEENAVESFAAAAAIDATEISTYDALYNEVNNQTGEIDIELAADMSATTSHITLASGAEVTIDLNGHTLAADDSATTALFTVPDGASLTITDSQAKKPVKGDGVAVSAADAGKTAEVESYDGTVTLTYYVTESEVTDSAAGYTAETRYPYTVESSGMISTTGTHALFSVEGGTLNIKSGFFFGGNTATSSRAIDASDLGTVNISGGYICGFLEGYSSGHGETVDGGAVRVSGSVGSGEDTTSTTLNISGDAVLAGNQAATGGAVDVADGAVLNMTGGVISGNEASESVTTSESRNDYGGGGIHIYKATAEIRDGYVTNNLSDCEGYFDGGGGILVYASTLRFTGGYITGNYAKSSGGGIRTAYAGTTATAGSEGNVYITGGYICANYAASAEGGGVCIDNGGTCAVMSIDGPIYLNNNETATDQHWGGGGLFCANGATTYMQDILVTDNDAGGYGGGVAGCSTGRIAIAEGAGAAIYNNTAAGTHLSGSESAKNDDHTYAEMNKIFQEYGYQDYFCALESQISGMMLGGYPANWTGSADGEAISNVGIYDILHAAYIMGLTAHPSTEAMEAAQDAATVYITGNSSSTHGGGVLANGYLLIGTVKQFEIPDALELNADKAFINSVTGEEEPIQEGQFTFTVTNELDAVVAIGTVDDTGAINFDRRLAFDAPGTYTFTIREDYDSIGSVIPDTTEYTLVVTVEETEGYVEIPDLEMRVEYTFYNITHYTLFEDGELVDDKNVTSDEDSIVHMTMPSYTFTNYTADEIAITVNKVWTDDGGAWPEDVDEIKVDLIRNGVVIDTATLTESNPSYTWEDLPTTGDDGEEYTYEVKEQNVSGYISSQVITSSSSGGNESYWVPLSETDDPSLHVGGQYLIAYGSGTDAVTLGQRSGQEDNPFGTEDSISINVNTDSLTFGGKTYSSYISDEAVQDRNSSNIIWTAVNDTKSDGILLKNANLQSWILIQNYNGTSGTYLKGTTGTAYASPLWMEQVGNFYYLQGWDGYASTTSYRYITYENGRFTSNTSTTNAATVYVKVTPITDSTTVTISNTHVDEASFSLNVRKVKGGDSNITLPDATFELYLKGEEGEEDTLLHFELTGDSTYKYLKGPDYGEEATTNLVTGSWGRFVVTDLPAGTYILHETEAPEGYQCADDIEIVLDENTEGTTVYLEVEDPTYPVNILKFTGDGTGTAAVENAGTYYLWREDSSGNLERAISFEYDGNDYSNIVWGTSSDEGGAINVTGTQTELKFEGLLSGYTYYLTTSHTEDTTTGYTPVEVTYENYLTGAEFMISKTVTETIEGAEQQVTYYACFSIDDTDENVITYKFHAWVTDPDDEKYSGYTFVLTSGSEGYIHIEGMDIGRYLLTETKAPDGYNMLAEPVWFTIERDNVATTAVKIGDYTIGVENYAAGELPNTGGPGTWIYTAIGVLLIGGAASLLVYRKRRAVRS